MTKIIIKSKLKIKKESQGNQEKKKVNQQAPSRINKKMRQNQRKKKKKFKIQPMT